jgi:hypothetical protein
VEPKASYLERSGIDLEMELFELEASNKINQSPKLIKKRENQSCESVFFNEVG